ncbi:hypothetical protein [Pontibacter chitinilyticus]|uniref:hypothetical protein n=1 Tax=Pontibacter chitinilyticus TaxID=2674989 RepID=UPI00321B0D4E
MPCIWHQEPVNATGMMGFAIIGFLVNSTAVLRLKAGSSLNERVVRLHLMEVMLG